MDPWYHVYDPVMTWGQIGVDFQERVNFDRLRKERLERTRKKMKEKGLDALILFNGDNIRYATGTFDYIWRTFMRYAMIPAASDPIVFEPVGPDTEHVLMNNPWLNGRVRPSMVWQGAWSAEEHVADRFAEGVKKALKEEGVLGGRIGADMLDGPSAKALSKAGIQTVDSSRAMMEARLIKTRDELEILKQICFVVDCAYDLLRNQWTRPGARESELAGRLAHFLFSNSFDQYGGNVSSGTNSNPYFRGRHTDKLVRRGETIIIDIVSQFLGYWSDYVRCWVVGDKPTEEQRAAYRECYDSLHAAMKAVKPGSTSKDIAEKFIENDESKYGTTSLIQGGHSVGLNSHEGFWITRAYSLDHPEKIEQNMYLALETHSQKGRFGARLEENLVVTDKGYQTFSLFPFEEV